jgi:predicted transcriptional regulator
MTQKFNAFKEILKRRGIKWGELAKEMNIHYSTLYRKAHGQMEWKVSELYYLSERLHIYFNISKKGMQIFLECADEGTITMDDLKKLLQ